MATGLRFSSLRVGPSIRRAILSHDEKHRKINLMPEVEKAAAVKADNAWHAANARKRSGLSRLSKNIRRETSRAGKNVKRESSRAGAEVERSAKKVEKEIKRVPKNLKKITGTIFGAFKFAKWAIILIVVGVVVLIVKGVIK